MIKKLLFACLLMGYISLSAQSMQDSSILVSASHNIGLNQITLSWQTTDAQGFQIHRKPVTSNNWTLMTSVPGTTFSYVDNAVQKGVSYEYRIMKTKGTRVRSIGYAAAGIQIPHKEYKYNILLVYDSLTFNSIPGAETKQLENDYYMDGYIPTVLLVSPNAKPPQVKALIKSWYNLNKTLNVHCLLIGRVPIPYSGLMLANTTDLPPDAHPDHGGCWPTDLYYAEMDGSWTDAGTMTTNLSNPLLINNPGDGKFDQHFIPDNIDIQIGRVDMSNLPSQSMSEVNLIRQYLLKLHNFKSGITSARNKAFISDNFGYLGGEMPMRSGWNNASALVGAANIVSTGNYFDSTKNHSYIFSDVMGGGSFTSCGGVGVSSQFNDSLLAVFNVMFGSYFGDWNNSDNFLRSCLASKGLSLTNVWAHRPHWYFHQMALGMPIGYSVITSQNNTTDITLNSGYIGSFGGDYLDRRISMNLMGDPTLRLHYFDRPKALITTKINSNKQVKLDWQASTEPGILGYNIYRVNRKDSVYYALNSSPVNALTYTDTDPHNGTNTYIVKAVKLETSNGGSYYNASLGVMAQATGVLGTNTSVNDISAVSFSVYPNPANTFFTVEGLQGSSIAVYDMNGRQIYTNLMETGRLVVSTDIWAKGIYVIKCKRDDQVKTEKLIIR
jgi:hypothetical protein